MTELATYPSLRDRAVLITGGGSGIGAAFVEAFTLQGAKVAFLDIAEQASRELLESLEGRSVHRPVFLPCDLMDIPSLQASIERATAVCGPIRVLVNNAGSDDRHHFSEVTPAYWDQRIAVNLKHQFFAAQAVAAGMKAAGGGSIVNMSSIAWMIPTPNLSVYETAKAAIVGMTKALAHDLGAAHIRVNCVSPGAILTERQRRLWMSPEYEREVLSRQCIQRNILPQDVASLALFLAADDSSAITNQNYIVDGGWI
jgi:NAD(P)-dependent dehydrogenase (short-subunit alcohol dehydrogenase family)